MEEQELKITKKAMAYDLKLIFKKQQDEETYKKTEAIIDAYIAGVKQ